MADAVQKPRFLAVLVFEEGEGRRTVEPHIYSVSHPEIAYQLAISEGQEERYGRPFVGLAHLEELEEDIEMLGRTEGGEAMELVVPKSELEAFNDWKWRAVEHDKQELREALSEPGQLIELEGLDEIPWHKLHHAYGSAHLVPKDIRRLVSTDSRYRKLAKWELSGSIYHQGSLYSATAPAIPFLLTAAEHMDEEDKAELVSLIAEIGWSAAASPSVNAASAYGSWTLWSDPTAVPDPKTTARERIAVNRDVLASIVGQIDRFTALVVKTEPELPEAILEANKLEWNGDFLEYAKSLTALANGVAQVVLSEPASVSYKALAKKLDPIALSATMLWWALEQDLAHDENALLADSLARDLNENIRRGWKTGKHYKRQTARCWETWTRRFWTKKEQTAKVTKHIENNAEQGWLPESREDELIVEAVKIGFGG